MAEKRRHRLQRRSQAEIVDRALLAFISAVSPTLHVDLMMRTRMAIPREKDPHKIRDVVGMLYDGLAHGNWPDVPATDDEV